MTTKCKNCPLRSLPLFKPFSPADERFMEKFKIGEIRVNPGTQILREGTSSPKLYTVLSGMGLRHKVTEDGNRQVVGFALPGDFLGLEAGIVGEMRHSVEATTDMVLCVFGSSALWSLFRETPSRAFALTQVAVREEILLAEVLTVLGQKSAIARVAWALRRFYDRLNAMELSSNGRVPMPYRQQDMAEGLGLSLVHTNKTLSTLRADGVAIWEKGWLSIPDPDALDRLAGISREPLEERPLI